MGYYSNLAQEYYYYGRDRSYTPPEQQLLWRLDDLYDRLEELGPSPSTFIDGTCWSDDYLRYVLPKYYKCTSVVEVAIELAINELRYEYGINVLAEPAPAEEVEIDEITYVQISFKDILFLQPHFGVMTAA